MIQRSSSPTENSALLCGVLQLPEAQHSSQKDTDWPTLELLQAFVLTVKILPCHAQAGTLLHY